MIMQLTTIRCSPAKTTLHTVYKLSRVFAQRFALQVSSSVARRQRLVENHMLACIESVVVMLIRLLAAYFNYMLTLRSNIIGVAPSRILFAGPVSGHQCLS